MNRVLVTGATGLVGGALLELLDEKTEAYALSRTAPERGDRCCWIKHDLTSQLPRQMPEGIDTVIHLAQSLRFREFPEAAGDIFEVNVGSTARLLEWASKNGVRRFVYASSGGIYGHGDEGFREDDLIRTPATLGYYLASKRSAELLVEAYESEFIVVILRFFFVYGPGQRESMLIPRLAAAVKAGAPVSLQAPDGIRINPIYVRDAAAAAKAALLIEESARVNVAGPDVLSIREIAEIIGRQVGREPTFSVAADDVPRHLVGDISRMRSLLHEPTVGFAEGIARTLEPGTTR